MKKLLVIFLVCGLMTSVIIPSAYAQTSKIVCKGNFYDGKNFKVWYLQDSDVKKMYNVLDQCAKEGWTINGDGVSVFHAHKK